MILVISRGDLSSLHPDWQTVNTRWAKAGGLHVKNFRTVVGTRSGRVAGIWLGSPGGSGPSSRKRNRCKATPYAVAAARALDPNGVTDPDRAA